MELVEDLSENALELFQDTKKTSIVIVSIIDRFRMGDNFIYGKCGPYRTFSVLRNIPKFRPQYWSSSCLVTRLCPLEQETNTAGFFTY